MKNRITIRQRIRRITSKVIDFITGKPDTCTMQEAQNMVRDAWTKSGYKYPMEAKDNTRNWHDIKSL